MEKKPQSESLANQAYKILKESIMNGDLQDEEPLPEEKLANNLGISRTPLRDALNRLAAEELIIQQKGAPAIVASFTKERSLEYMELRSLLEVYNIERIITILEDDVIVALEENLENQRFAIKGGTYNDFIEQDRQFHLLLASVNHNRELRELIHKMNTGVNRAFIILSKTVPQSAEEAYSEHVELLNALKQRNVVLAKNKMLIHMNNVEKRFLYFDDK
ncbi:GntR family transcriptional regulator [Lentibacillus lipolyticus]|nr:GntR family transcriptional regulator [Lentibacillus lipolyticus]